MSFLEGQVLSGRAAEAPMAVHAVLSPRPDWMPQTVARQIEASLLPEGANYYDKHLADAVRDRALANPWVRRVMRVTKYPGDHGTAKPNAPGLERHPGIATIEIEAEFRMPIAKAPAESGYAYLDAEGYRLPALQVAQWAGAPAADPSHMAYYVARTDIPRGAAARRIHYIEVQGAEAPPPAVGKQWPGQDVAAGLTLVCLVAPKPYAYQVTVVDVRNFAGRLARGECHLKMLAQIGNSTPTEIRFGRFPRPEGDYVVSPERAMSYLDEYVRTHGCLAGLNKYLDLRYDELHVSVN